MDFVLTTKKGTTLFSIKKSDQCPNYSTALQIALDNKVNLSGLKLVGKELDSIRWESVSIDNFSFEKCSLKNNHFNKCNGKGFDFKSCDLSHSIFNHLNVSDNYIMDCKIRAAKFINMVNGFSHVLDCDFSESIFEHSILDGVCFNSCNLSNALFRHCSLIESHFIHIDSMSGWTVNLSFLECNLMKCFIKDINRISDLYLWKSNVWDAKFENDEEFIEVVNKYSRVLYAINSDVVWWKPLDHYHPDKGYIFKGNLAELDNEVNNGFPVSKLYPHLEVFISNELDNLSSYLKQLRSF